MAAGRRILFATSNGTGLGHLNRSMAIARRLGPGVEASFFTLSQAAPVVAAQGFRVDYHPSYRRPGSGSDWQWNMRLRRRLERLFQRRRPDLVVFDGVHPYRALTHLLTAAGAPPSVWCRRPLWRAESPSAALRRTRAFDWVLEPGELAAELDRGATVERRGEAIGVPPIVLLEPEELVDRERAAAELGLDPNRTTALVNLGQGGEVDRAVGRVLDRLGREPGLQIAALQSSIGAAVALPEGVVTLEATFPMSRYFKAFDLAVSAAGYNAFHELVAFAVPSLFVPMARQTDEQAARSRWAEAAGIGIASDGPADPALDRKLRQLLDPGRRAELAAGCRERFVPGGAAAAAATVEGIAAGEPPHPPLPAPSALGRWLHMSSHPLGPSLPLAAALTARDLIRHPERRRPQAIVLAIEVEPGTMAARIEQLLEAIDAPAGRVLVITDSAELAVLRRAGVGVHRVPAASELGLSADDAAYGRVVGEVADAALAPWRGDWAIRGFGGWFERDAGAIPGRVGAVDVQLPPLP